jgi:hypothetical protein
MLDNDTKPCSYCAELVKKEAKICRFCHMDFSTGRPVGSQNIADQAPNDSESTTDQAHKEVQARSGVKDGVKLGFGMFIVLPVLIILGLFLGALFLGAIGSNVTFKESWQTSASKETMQANEALTTARNKGWHWAQDSNAKTTKACEALSNANERYGCEKYVENMLL